MGNTCIHGHKGMGIHGQHKAFKVTRVSMVTHASMGNRGFQNRTRIAGPGKRKDSWKLAYG